MWSSLPRKRDDLRFARLGTSPYGSSVKRSKGIGCQCAKGELGDEGTEGGGAAGAPVWKLEILCLVSSPQALPLQLSKAAVSSWEWIDVS